MFGAIIFNAIITFSECEKKLPTTVQKIRDKSLMLTKAAFIWSKIE